MIKLILISNINNLNQSKFHDFRNHTTATVKVRKEINSELLKYKNF